MSNVNQYKAPNTGNIVKSDGGILNLADLLAVVTNADNGVMQVSLKMGGSDVGAANPLPVSATINATVAGEVMKSAPTTKILTVTETPVVLSSKVGLQQIVVRNSSESIRVRIGESSMTVSNRKGIPIEPGAMVIESFDPTVPVSLYVRSEGSAIELEVWEV